MPSTPSPSSVRLPSTAGAAGYSRSRWCHFPEATIGRIQKDIATCLQSGMLVGGVFTERLEAHLSGYWGIPAAAVTSGTAVLELIWEHLAIRGQTVLVPANCFEGVAATVAARGGISVPVPIDPISMSMDPEALLARTADARAIIWVHHCGMVSPRAREAIQQCRERGMFVVEDCAYLIPVDGPGDRPGTWGDATLLSFFATKPVSGGKGGAILTRDSSLLAYVQQHRSHGGGETIWGKGDTLWGDRTIGNPHAIIAYYLLQDLPDIRERLHAVGQQYEKLIQKHMPSLLPGGRHATPTSSKLAVQLPPQHRSRDMRSRLMAEAQIQCSIMYERPWFTYPWFLEKLGAPQRDWSDLHELLEHTICLPYHEKLTPEEQEYVIERLVEMVQ